MDGGERHREVDEHRKPKSRHRSVERVMTKLRRMVHGCRRAKVLLLVWVLGATHLGVAQRCG